MNIGIDIRPLMSKNRTGVGEYTYELLNAVFKIDKANQYFLFYNSYQDVSTNMPKWDQNNVHLVATHYPNKLLSVNLKIFGWPKLDKTIIKNFKLETRNLDVFFSPNLNFTSVSLNTKFILTIHDLSFEFFPEFFSLKQRLWHRAVNPKKQCERANIILTPSENTKRDVVECYKINPDKIQVLYPGLAPIFSTPPIKDPASLGMIKKKYNLPDKYILFLGTVEARKNVIGLIKAFEKAHPRLPADFYLIIAGAPGFGYEEIYEYAQKSSYKEKIKFIDYIDAADKPSLYASARLFIYPSFYEGFGFPILEAMASGIPIITSNRTSLTEITGSSEYLINPNNPDQIAEAMVKILNSPELQKEQIKNGLIEAEHFSWQNAAENFQKIISS